MGHVAALLRLTGDTSAWLRQHPTLTHVSGSIVLACVCLVLLAVTDVGIIFEPPAPPVLFLAPVAVALTGSLLRRPHPGLSFTLSITAVIADVALGGSNALIIYVVDGFYSASCYGRAALRRTVIILAAAGALLTTVGLAVLSGEPRGAVIGALQGAAIFGTPVWWGTNVRQRNEITVLSEQQLALERLRTRNTERITQLTRDEAVREERAHMARELHDVVASQLSAIAIGSAAALEIPDSDSTPHQTQQWARQRRDVLETVRASSVAALDDMQSLITVLRAGDSRQPEVTASDVSLSGFRSLQQTAAGIDITLELPDAGAYEQLPEPIRQALIRIAGEIIANAAKHAAQSRLLLRLELGQSIVLTGKNTTGNTIEQSVPSAGIGLRVMRERAEAFGGTLAAGPTPEGWQVDVRLPAPAEREET